MRHSGDQVRLCVNCCQLSGSRRYTPCVYADPNKPASLGEAVEFAPGARDQRAFESHGEDVAIFTTVAFVIMRIQIPVFCALLTDVFLAPCFLCGPRERWLRR
jgi:hypothetical protein